VKVKFTWLTAAALIAGWLIVRRHKQKRWFQAVLVLAIVAAALVGFGVVRLPNVEQLLEDAGSALGQWTYLVVGLLAFAETGAFVGFIAPGETAVIVAGLVAGQGRISLFGLIAIVWTCAVLGDLTSYELGRRLGREWLLRHGARLQITEARLEQVESFFAKRGGATILIGRFLGFVRPIAPFIAGASRMPLRRFVAYDVLAAGLWSIAFCVLGYVFWRSIDQLTTYVSRGLFAFGTLVVVIAAIVVLIRLRRDPQARARAGAWLDARAQEPGWRLLARVARPAWHLIGRPVSAVADGLARFGAERLTPGNLGLELTTLLALVLSGAYAFLLIGGIVADGPPRIDRWAADVVDAIRTPALDDVAKVVTPLGSLAAALVAAALTGVWALMRRRYEEAGALVVGLVLAYALVHVGKAAYDRPRPGGSLVETALSSYPSGHATYVVTLLACATMLVRGGVGWAARIFAVGVAIAVVALVAATRVYLGAHYLTDVLGGIAGGLAVWSIAGMLALLAGRVRHNGAALP